MLETYENIKKLRKLNKWTQEELAEKMGYTSKSTINKIEKNINDVGQRKILKFAQVFGCDVTDLICDNPATVIEKPNQLDVSQYDPELIERAIAFVNAFDNQIPEVQDAVLRLLKPHQSDS